MSTKNQVLTPTTSLAGKLPELSPAFITLLRQAYTSRPQCSGQSTLHWQPAANNWSARYCIELATAHHRYSMWLEGLQGFSSFFSGPFPSWPAEQWHALAECALEPVLDAVSLVIGSPVEMASIADVSAQPPKIPPTVIEFSFTPHANGRPVIGAIELRADEHYCFASAMPLPHARIDRLVLPVQMRLGSLRIAVGLLAGPRVGDVLRLDAPPQAALPTLRLLLYGHRQIARAVAHGTQLEIVDLTSHAWINMTTATLNQLQSGEQTSTMDTLALDALEVELAFDVGALNMPLAEIARLRAGVVLGLGSAIRDHVVTIRSNGQTVGRGELVLAGDELAVRISHWTICSNA